MDTAHGNEPAYFPSVETERQISRIEGLVQFILENQKEKLLQAGDVTALDAIRDIQESAQQARRHFRDYLMNVSDERMRLIEQVSCASASD